MALLPAGRENSGMVEVVHMGLHFPELEETGKLGDLDKLADL